MPNVRASSGTIGTISRPMSLVAQQLRQQPHEHHGRRDLAPAGALRRTHRRGRLRRRGQRLGAHDPRADESAERLAALAQVPRSPGCRPAAGRTAPRRSPSSRDRDAEARAELAQLLLVQLLLLVRDVLALAGLAEAVALDGRGQDDGRRPLVLHRRLVGGVDLPGIVAAAAQLLQLLVGQVPDHARAAAGPRRRSARGCRRPARRRTSGTAPSTISPMRLHQQPVVIPGEQRIPVAAPDHLDDVPAGAAERGLEFLDDLAVAAHRAVQPLQVAVDDEDQVVELLAGRQRDRAERLGLVGLAVAEKAQTFVLRRRLRGRDPQVPDEPRLVDRHERAEPHRDASGTPRSPASARDADTTTAPRPAELAPEVLELLAVERPSRNARA